MWRLFFPLRYFRLVNSEKRHIDLWPTLLLTIIIATPFIVAPEMSFFREGGFLDKLLLLTSALTGFYVAALVAAATFPIPDLNKVITLGAITIGSRSLTRREFACTIFGYLAYASLMLSVFSALFISMSAAKHEHLLAWIPWAGHALTKTYFGYVRAAFVILFSAAVAHLITATSLGLYYLMDRLYRQEPEVLGQKRKRAA